MEVKCVCEIPHTQINIATDVIRTSFATVAAEFGLTEQNCPNHTSFITAGTLHSQFELGWLMYGLYKDKRLVGYVSLSNENDGVYEMHNLAILPEYRRRGYGKQLIDFCKGKVKELGGHKIDIGIIDENITLKNGYAANGFVHTGTETFTHLPFTAGFMTWEALMFGDGI